ncbi:MAG: hypothetical protein M5R40_25920 [Anaerolineae bacterium]|nr:hypothetical protein [Anaerolineae bacterium]
MRVHPLDYRRPVAYTVHVELDEVSVTDEYRLDGRTLKLRWKKAVDGHYVGEVETFQYANLIGRLPIVHLPNDRSTNELFGRPVYEAMLDLFYRYDVLLRKRPGRGRNPRQPDAGRGGAEDPEKVKEVNGEEVEYYDAASGTYQNVFEIIWHRLTMLILGKGASFKFASPSVGFSEDIRSMLSCSSCCCSTTAASRSSSGAGRLRRARRARRCNCRRS